MMKRGDTVVTEGGERTFLVYIEGAEYPFRCVNKHDNIEDEDFRTVGWKEAKLPNARIKLTTDDGQEIFISKESLAELKKL